MSKRKRPAGIGGTDAPPLAATGTDIDIHAANMAAERVGEVVADAADAGVEVSVADLVAAQLQRPPPPVPEEVTAALILWAALMAHGGQITVPPDRRHGPRGEIVWHELANGGLLITAVMPPSVENVP